MLEKVSKMLDDLAISISLIKNTIMQTAKGNIVKDIEAEKIQSTIEQKQVKNIFSKQDHTYKFWSESEINAIHAAANPRTPPSQKKLTYLLGIVSHSRTEQSVIAMAYHLGYCVKKGVVLDASYRHTRSTKKRTIL
nr:MAG TPA: hypothetical protein [Caudoviricetes sp.]